MSELPDITGPETYVGGRFRVQWSTRDGGIRCEWTPDVPSPRDWRRKVDGPKYRAARDAFLAELMRLAYPDAKNPRALVIELPIEGGSDL